MANNFRLALFISRGFEKVPKITVEDISFLSRMKYHEKLSLLEEKCNPFKTKTSLVDLLL